jgi:lipoprotein-releasing system ATP-binding protein
MSEPLLAAKNLFKSYPQGVGELRILHDISLSIFAGESISIVGSSGAGKSTLMHILGTLDRPNSGELIVAGRNVLSMGDDELALYRNSQMGFVFQFHHLLQEFTALENVTIPLRIAGVERMEARDKAAHFLSSLGLGDRGEHYPTQLSGGELQRVAIARALICNPKILFADEPTGNLDSKNSLLIQDLFFELKQRLGLTLVVVTHDANFAKKFSRTLRISDGQWAI